METLINDAERLNKFLGLLPENEMHLFLNGELWLGMCRYRRIAMLDGYGYYRREILSNFQNPKIKKANEDFDIIFKKLDAFLEDHFFALGSNFALYPDHKYSKDKLKKVFWNKSFKELTLLRNQFEKKYIAFITIATKELYKAQKINALQNTNKEPVIKLPQNTKWEEITIKFKDPFEVEIFKKKTFIERVDYIKLRFCSGEKNKKPDRQWQFLILLSLLQGKNQKNATISEMATSLSKYLGKKISANNCETIKKNLSIQLAESFGIDRNDDPFYDYNKCGCYYKPMFTLKPVPNMRGVHGNGDVYIAPRGEFKEDIDYNAPKKGYHKTEY